MANKIYQIGETEIEWTDTAGNLAMDFSVVGADDGRQGAQKDLGATSTARSNWYLWRAIAKWDTAPTLGEHLDFYLKFGDNWDSTDYYDNDDGTGDIQVSAEDKLRNLLYIGSVVCDEALADIASGASGGPIWIPHRYVLPVCWNPSGNPILSTTNDDTRFWLQPLPLELQ